MKTIVRREMLPEAAIVIGNFRYYTVSQICAAIGCPDHVLIDRVRDPNENIHGRKLGEAYLIDEAEFNEWVKTGNFSFTKRTRAKPLEPLPRPGSS